MPTRKDLKRLVRARMAATGERYTQAYEAITDEGRAVVARRAIGLETRYAAHLDAAGGNVMSDQDVAVYLFRRVVAWGRSTTVYLENGSRLGLNADGQVEYATPECTSVGEAVMYQQAGHHTMALLAGSATDALGREGIRGRVRIGWGGTDAGGACHESYSAPAGVDLRTSSVLEPFLATRPVIAAGGQSLDGAFALCRRRTVPLVTRAAPFADAGRYQRIHIQSDPNTWAATTALALGATHLVVRMLEDSWDLPDMRLADTLATLRIVEGDPSCRRTIRLASGRSARATTVQRALADRAHRYLRHHSATPEERLLADRWRGALDMVGRRDSDGVEWISSYRRWQEGAPGADASGPTTTVDPDVAHAIDNPPATGRAALRARFIRAAKQHRRDFTVDWQHLKLNDRRPGTIVLSDPLEHTNSRVDRLIAEIERSETEP